MLDYLKRIGVLIGSVVGVAILLYTRWLQRKTVTQTETIQTQEKQIAILDKTIEVTKIREGLEHEDIPVTHDAIVERMRAKNYLRKDAD